MAYAGDPLDYELDVHYLRFLVWAGERLGRSLHYRETLVAISDAAVMTVADLCIVDIGEAGSTQCVGAAHRDPAQMPRLRAVGEHLHSEPGRPLHPVCQVLKSGRTFFAPHIDDAWIESHAAGAAHAAFMRSMQYESLVVVPMSSQVFGVTGALTLVTTRGGRPPFGPDAVIFAEDLGRRCGAAIGKALLYADARNAAKRFQEAALPRVLPQAPGVFFDGLYRPADSSLLVGGDWFDAFFMPDGRIGISVGDVSGHGLSAAVIMASMKNALRTALAVEPDLERALTAVDFVRAREDEPDRFCTAMLSILDLNARTLTCLPAGHPGPELWSPATGSVKDPFTDRGLPLGCRMLNDRPPKPQTILLEPGSVVVFYTDGLVEWNRDTLEGEAALIEALSLRAVRESQHPAAAIYRHVVKGKARDDVAILVICVDGSSPAQR